MLDFFQVVHVRRMEMPIVHSLIKDALTHQVLQVQMQVERQLMFALVTFYSLLMAVEPVWDTYSVGYMMVTMWVTTRMGQRASI